MVSLVFQYLPLILGLSSLVMVALISPGPDFAVTVRNSLVYSRRTGLLTALGIAIGSLIHTTYTLFGLGIIIRETPWIFLPIKYIGAAYLLYIGFKGLRAKKSTLALGNMKHVQDITPLSALRSGFLTNALNPKAMLFCMSLFSAMIPPQTPVSILILCGFIIFIETLAWFSFVAFCLSGKRTREKFHAMGHWIERITGGVLISLAARLIYMV